VLKDLILALGLQIAVNRADRLRVARVGIPAELTASARKPVLKGTAGWAGDPMFEASSTALTVWTPSADDGDVPSGWHRRQLWMARRAIRARHPLMLVWKPGQSHLLQGRENMTPAGFVERVAGVIDPADRARRFPRWSPGPANRKKVRCFGDPAMKSRPPNRNRCKQRHAGKNPKSDDLTLDRGEQSR